jgi:hypothetical protein
MSYSSANTNKFNNVSLYNGPATRSTFSKGDSIMIRQFAVAAIVLSVSSAVAQQGACTGKQNVVRVSEIKPGMMTKFEEAVAAQAAWYKKAGTSDEIKLLHVLDMATHDWSQTEALTEHISTGKSPAHDAGFDAFVALFTASSTIKTQYITCEK